MLRSGTSSATQASSLGRAGLALGLLWATAAALLADAHEARAARSATAVATRFSSLAELTPRNVRGLMPLSSLPVEVGPPHDANMADRGGAGRAAQLGSLAAGDERLREFVSSRVALTAGAAAPVAAGSHGTGVAVSLVAAPAGAAGQVGTLTAWDTSHARIVWAAAGQPAAAKSGALVTAGGLILYCSADGRFNVLDVGTGRELWKHQLAGGARGTPISYVGPDGHQYIAVLTELHGHKASLQSFSLPR